MRILMTIAISMLTYSNLSTASAQFAGDIFVETPSIAVGQNETAKFQFQAFSGIEVFGAASIDIIFDESLVSFIDLSPLTEFTEPSSVTFKKGNGTVSVVVVNSSSLEAPIGTASLFEIEFMPTAPEGTIIPITVENNGYLTAGDVDIARSAFGAEIVVTQSASQKEVGSIAPQLKASTMGVPIVAKENSNLQARVMRLRPAGTLVELPVKQVNTNQWELNQVISAQSE